MASVTPGLHEGQPTAPSGGTEGTAAVEPDMLQLESSRDASSALPTTNATTPADPADSSGSGGHSGSNKTESMLEDSDVFMMDAVQAKRGESRSEPYSGDADPCKDLPAPMPASHAEGGRQQPDSTERHMNRSIKPEATAEASGAGTSGPCVTSREVAEEGAIKAEEPLDVASLFMSPSDDFESWGSDGKDLMLPASSFVSAEAISQHRGPMSLGKVALFIFGLFQGDVRMGLLSAQGRLLAWRCLLYLAEQHDRQYTAQQSQQQPQQAASQAAGISAGDPGMRRRRLQRESVATSKGRRSVRHAFLLDRSGASRTAAAGPVAGGSGLSPGGNDEWGEAEEEPVAASTSLKEEVPGEVATEQAFATPSMGVAVSLQRQLEQTPRTLGFELHMPRFIGGSIDRRWALQQRSLRVPPDTLKADTLTGKEEPLDVRLEEFGAATAPKMWPRVETLPERIFVGLPIQVACWVGWGRTDGRETGRMLWRDCEVTQIISGDSFVARCFCSAGEPRQLTCHIRDFVPPRVPAPSPHECAWRLVPKKADPERDIYPGACLSVGLGATNISQQEHQQPEMAGAYFVDVVVQDIYFTLEQTTRARQALAEAREREDASGSRGAPGSSRRIPGCTDTGGPVEGLRPNCPVRAMRVMVLRNGGAPSEFALVSGRTIYKLGYDLFAHTGKEAPARHQQRQGGGSRFTWAIPRALCPAAPERVKGASGAAITGGNLEASAKRWQYRTQEDSREWVNFPPFLVAYLPYDCIARYTETHPLLIRYLQPELDLAAVSRGIWRLCLPQYDHPNVQPVLVPHPSDMPHQEDKHVPTSGETGAASAEGVVVLERPYASSSSGFGGGSEARGLIASEEVADSLSATHAGEPPQLVGSTQTSGDGSERASVLGVNHLTSLLCSAGDTPPPKELLSKALPFFRGLLPHLGSQFADTWQLEVARAAIRAADQAKELYVDEQETEAEKLRCQGISFGGPGGGGVTTERERDQKGAERAGWTAEDESGEGWEWVGTAGSRYPTSSDISRFLLRTSGHGVGAGPIRGRGMEPGAPQTEGATAASGGGRRRTLDAVAGLLSGESRKGTASELGGSEGRGTGEDSTFVPGGAGGGEGDFHSVRRAVASASMRVVAEQAVTASRARAGLSPAAVAPGTFGTSPATARRRPVMQREEEEDFQPPARAATGSRQGSGSGRVGVARRAARNVSYTALAGMDPGPEDPALYRPIKRIARSDLHTASLDHSAADQWDHLHAKDVGPEASGSDRHVRSTLQQWAALQRQATAADERLLHSQATRGQQADRGAEGSISTDQLHEALKGFLQSIKAGTSPPVVSVPPMARNRSFAASH